METVSNVSANLAFYSIMRNFFCEISAGVRKFAVDSRPIIDNALFHD